jgi:CDGSH-type Zn-finger protein
VTPKPSLAAVEFGGRCEGLAVDLEEERLSAPVGGIGAHMRVEDLGEAVGGQDAVLTPYPDGPLVLRGKFRILDVEGREIDPERRTVALCRCGRSALKPFCDGSHRAGFKAAGGDERPPRRRFAPEVGVAVSGGAEPTPRVVDAAE